MLCECMTSVPRNVVFGPVSFDSWKRPVCINCLRLFNQPFCDWLKIQNNIVHFVEGTCCFLYPQKALALAEFSLTLSDCPSFMCGHEHRLLAGYTTIGTASHICPNLTFSY